MAKRIKCVGYDFPHSGSHNTVVKLFGVGQKGKNLNFIPLGNLALLDKTPDSFHKVNLYISCLPHSLTCTVAG
jgi:hypothetical protein